MATYTIKSVGPTKDITTKFGSMKVYSIQFEGSDDWVEITQKPQSAPPSITQPLEGTIEDTQYGKRFKKAQAGGFSGGGRAQDPDTRRSIERQSALKAAVDAVHNYSTTLGVAEEGVDLKKYLTRIVNTANVFSSAIAAGTAAKPADAPKTDVQQVQEVMGKDAAEIQSLPENDQIDLSDIPF